MLLNYQFVIGSIMLKIVAKSGPLSLLRTLSVYFRRPPEFSGSQHFKIYIHTRIYTRVEYNTVETGNGHRLCFTFSKNVLKNPCVNKMRQHGKTKGLLGNP